MILWNSTVGDILAESLESLWMCYSNFFFSPNKNATACHICGSVGELASADAPILAILEMKQRTLEQ